MGSPDGLPEQLPAPRPGGHPRTRRATASPPPVHDPYVQSALHPFHHPLPRTHRPLGGTRHRLPPPRRLHPPPTQPRPRHVRQGGMTRTTPTSGARGNANPWTRCSPSAAATRALVGRCIASPSGPNGPGGSPRTDGCGWSHCAPSRGKPPQTAGDPTPHAPPPYNSAHTWWQPAS